MTYLGVAIGNPLYFLFFGVLFACLAGSIIFARKASQESVRKAVLIIAWSNFALHFLKQLSPGYIAEWPQSLGKSTFENLCATLILLTPFILLTKSPILHDYLFYIGILSGIVVFIYPTGAIKAQMNDFSGVFETLRFYLCHIPLAAIPLMLAESGLYKPNYRRLWSIPVCFMAIEAIILVNSVILFSLGVTYNSSLPDGTPFLPGDWAAFFSNKTFYNQSMTFGPLYQFEGALEPLIKIFIPYLQVFYINGVRYYTPVIWIMIPVLLATIVVGPLLCLRYEWRHMKDDWHRFWSRQSKKDDEKNENQDA